VQSITIIEPAIQPLPAIAIPLGPEPQLEPCDRIGACLVAAFPLAGEVAPFRAKSSTRPMASSKPFRNGVALPKSGATAGSVVEHEISRTEISFQPEAPSDRRGDDRSKISVYRSAMLRWREFEVLCLIRNISPGGLMGKIHLDLPRGESVTVEIRSGRRIAGHIAWSRDGMAGVQFDDRIDVLEVLHAPIHGEAELAQRMPRVRIGCPVTLTLEGGAKEKVKLIDVSQGGAKVEADFLKVGEDLTVAIHDLEPRRGVVRWAQDGRAGITFLTAIPFDALAHWVLERQAEAAEAEAAGRD
jgi:hypothetical protein